MNSFLSRDRLLQGPWSAFERAIVRYYLHIGSISVYYTGGPGDKGCDIFVIDENENRIVVQCKFTISDNPAGKSGIDDLRRGCFEYSANKGILCINSRSISSSAQKEIDELISLGLEIDTLTYHKLLKMGREIPLYSQNLFLKTRLFVITFL